MKKLILFFTLLMLIIPIGSVWGLEAVWVRPKGEGNVSVNTGVIKLINTPAMFRIYFDMDANVTMSSRLLSLECNGTLTEIDTTTADYNTTKKVIDKINTLKGLSAEKLSKQDENYSITTFVDFAKIEINASKQDKLDINATQTFSLNVSHYDTLGKFIDYVKANVTQMSAGLANNMFKDSDGWEYLNNKNSDLYTDKNAILNIGANFSKQFGWFAYMSDKYYRVMFSLDRLGIRNFDVLDYNVTTENLIIMTR